MTKVICVWYWFIFLPYVYVHFLIFHAGQNIGDFVNKTSRD